MLLFFLFPSPIWEEFGTGYVHRHVLSGSDFHENRCSESRALFRGVTEFVCIPVTFVL